MDTHFLHKKWTQILDKKMDKILDIKNRQKQTCMKINNLFLGGLDTMSPGGMIEQWITTYPDERANVENLTIDQFYSYLSNHEGSKI